MTQGKNAVSAGKMAEDMVRHSLERAGFVDLAGVLPKRDYKDARMGWFANSLKAGIARSKDFGNKFFLEQVTIRESIYGNPVKIDFVCHSDRLHNGLVIECKTQSVAGSVDEKYPYTHLTLEKIATVNDCKAAFFLGGGGARQCVYDYLSKQRSNSFAFFNEQAELLKYLKLPNNDRLMSNEPV
jgi:hypothetical protein